MCDINIKILNSLLSALKDISALNKLPKESNNFELLIQGLIAKNVDDTIISNQVSHLHKNYDKQILELINELTTTTEANCHKNQKENLMKLINSAFKLSKESSGSSLSRMNKNLNIGFLNNQKSILLNDNVESVFAQNMELLKCCDDLLKDLAMTDLDTSNISDLINNLQDISSNYPIISQTIQNYSNQIDINIFSEKLWDTNVEMKVIVQDVKTYQTMKIENKDSHLKSQDIIESLSQHQTNFIEYVKAKLDKIVEIIRDKNVKSHANIALLLRLHEKNEFLTFCQEYNINPPPNN